MIWSFLLASPSGRWAGMGSVGGLTRDQHTFFSSRRLLGNLYTQASVRWASVEIGHLFTAI